MFIAFALIASLLLVVAPPGVGPARAVVGSVESQVAQSSDDAEESVVDGDMYVDSTDLEITLDPGLDGQHAGENQIVGIRFQNITVPPGAVVTSARIDFIVDEPDDSQGISSLTVQAEAVDNAATFVKVADDISNRPKTTASVAWAPSTWDTGAATESTVDISAVIQEVVDRGGWLSGNALAIIIAGSETRSAVAYDGVALNAPTLFIEWETDTTDPVVTITSPTVDQVIELDAVVNAVFECTDADSGIDSCVGTVADGAAIDTATLGGKSFTVTGTDNFGNETVVTHNYTVVDTVDPVVTITSPSVDQVVGLYAVVNADFACTDADSGIDTCVGTVANGDPIDTATLGAKTFTVTGMDIAGNDTVVTHTYTVVAVQRFVDTGDSVFEADIDWLAAREITAGCNPPTNNRYCPEDPVTRGQMAAFLERSLSDVLSVDLSRAMDFVDTDDSVFENDIEWLSAADITRSCNPQDGGTRYCPDDLVTRGQMSAFLNRAFSGLIPAPPATGPVFTDSQNSIFALDIQWMADTGISKGCNPPTNDLYCPTANVTRGEMAAFIHRAFDAAGL